MNSASVSITIVLSAYNGSKYIVEQLDSLRWQARPADQVLISDDCSTDGTPNIVDEYIQSNALDDWTLIRNSENKGWKKNFHGLIADARGDLIFLCDQDDIWMPDKVESMATVMETHPEIDVLACSVEAFYETGSQKVTGEENLAGTDSGQLRFQHVDARAVYVQRPGCSYCVRRSFVKQVEPYWNDEWAHDAVLWILAEAKGSLALYDRTLMRFRRHEGNASAREKMLRTKRMADVEDLEARVDVMEQFCGDHGYLTTEKRTSLESLRHWLQARLEFLDTRSPRSLRDMIVGRDHYLTSRGLPVDMFLALFLGASL